MYLAFPGELLTRMLRETVLPLMTSSVIAAVGSMELALVGRIGRRALVYLLLTKIAAQGGALLVSFVLQPGSLYPKNPNIGAGVIHASHNGTTDMLYDLVR